MKKRIEWLQVLGNCPDYFSNEGHVSIDDFRWMYPTRQYHLHVGRYNQQPQITIIVDGVSYSYQHDYDVLGTRTDTGTAKEMFEVMQIYARML